MNIKFTGALSELDEGIRVIAEMLGVSLADGEYVFEVVQRKENQLTVTLNQKKGTIVYRERCALYEKYADATINCDGREYQKYHRRVEQTLRAFLEYDL